jgi:hypothetical protein
MNKDKELELLLAQLRNAKPNNSQMAKWQMAVQTELGKTNAFRKPMFRWTTQMAAVLATGFILGAVTSQYFIPTQENTEPVATIQYTFSKSE